ncbi:MAG: hypothetical protein JSW54_11735 [Fidelibacterota bacterium]|nr:MAG: hypothetical protein JSW54_11735 [Candidatus Neomarinimicrobiota bacterium]
MILLLVAFFGLLVPNGLFLYWLVVECDGLAAVFGDRLALAFILDAFMILALLSVYFRLRPIGPVPWYWFGLLSLVGGLGFSLPFYWWLNRKRHSHGS